MTVFLVVTDQDIRNIISLQWSAPVASDLDCSTYALSLDFSAIHTCICKWFLSTL